MSPTFCNPYNFCPVLSTRSPDKLFFPTIHIHDGQVHDAADFDHYLYYQDDGFSNAPAFTKAVRLEKIASEFMDARKTMGMTQPVYNALQQRRFPDIPAAGSLGLFYSGLELLPESFGQPGKSLTQALQGRLLPKFKFLLAGRLLKLMLNPTSARLRVKAAVQVAGQKELVAQAIAVRGGGQAETLNVELSAKQIRVNDKIQVIVENNEAKPLNCAVVFLSADGEVLPLPFTSVVPAAGKTIAIPGDKATVTVEPPLGMAEVMVIFSTASLDRAIAQLQILADTRGDDLGEQAVSTVDMLLDDLSGTRSGEQGGDRRLSTDQMAALSVSFEIIQ